MLPWTLRDFLLSKLLGTIPYEGFHEVTKGGEQILQLNFLPCIQNRRMDVVAVLQTPVASSAY
jgi:hypothetical protein